MLIDNLGGIFSLPCSKTERAEGGQLERPPRKQQISRHGWVSPTGPDSLVAKLDKEDSLNNVALAEIKGPLILEKRAARTRLICQSNRLFGLVYSVEVGCQNFRSDTMSEYKWEEY